MISQVPDRSAYLRQPTGLANTFLSIFGAKITEISNTPILAPNRAGKIWLFSIKVIINEKPEKSMPAAAVRKNTCRVALLLLPTWREQRKRPTTPRQAAIGNTGEICSFLMITAKAIKLNDCTKATTGPTNETEPTEKAW